MTETQEIKSTEPSTSGGCCCSSTKEAKLEVAVDVDVQKDEKSSCCMKAEDDKNHSTSSTAE